MGKTNYFWHRFLLSKMSIKLSKRVIIPASLFKSSNIKVMIGIFLIFLVTHSLLRESGPQGKEEMIIIPSTLS